MIIVVRDATLPNGHNENLKGAKNAEKLHFQPNQGHDPTPIQFRS